MSLNSLTRAELQELEVRGLDSSAVEFVEALIAKKQVVLLEEAQARAKLNGELKSAVRELQQDLIRHSKLVTLEVKPCGSPASPSTYVTADWISVNGELVHEVL